ncbi:hypothetical protein D3C72_1370500 [compost metagenome]
MQGDRRIRLETLGEIFALQDARHRVLGRQLNHAARAERIAPFRVVADLGAFRIQHQAGLREVSLRVLFDLFFRQRRARDVAAGRIADHRGEIADQEDDLMAQILQLTHLVENDGVPEVQIWCSRVQAEFDAQRLASLFRPRELLREL